MHVVFGALVGAIGWNLVTWYYGIPSQLVARADRRHRRRGDRQGRRGLADRRGHLEDGAFIFVSPLLGFLLGSLMMVLVAWIFRRATPLARGHAGSAGCSWSRPALYSLGHGGNDAQKTIGIIWMLLIATGYAAADADAAADVGDLVLLHRHRPGHDVRRLAHRQDHGPEDHQAQAGRRLLRRDRRRADAVPGHRAGHPGVDHAHHHRRDRRRGLGAQRARAVRWGVAGNIVWAWIFTIPASAFVAGVFYALRAWLAASPERSVDRRAAYSK